MTNSTILSVWMLSSMTLIGHIEPLTSIPVSKSLDVKVFLEGAFNPGTGLMTATLNALIPLTQPYNTAPWYYSGTESVGAIPPGVVDWVLVELRDAATPAEAVTGLNLTGWPKALFLKSDGTVVGLDGTGQPDLGSPTIAKGLFVVIRHRSHLPVLSATGATLAGDIYSWDFTTGLAQAYGGPSGYKMSGIKAVMVAGDIDQDENVFVSDFNSWAGGFGTTEAYHKSDLDLDRNVYVSDFNKWATNFGSTTEVGSGLTTFTDSRDGHVYKFVRIGAQTWMEKNLAYLPSVNSSSSSSSTIPCYYVYGYSGTNVSEAKGSVNYTTYGVLYNWPAAISSCPTGWHLPTDEEWKILEKNQGMSISDADNIGWRSSGTVGGKLKESGTTHWSLPNTGATNSSGFTALPGGYFNNGIFWELGFDAFLWTATENGPSQVWRRDIYYGDDAVNRDSYSHSHGFAVRCVKND